MSDIPEVTGVLEMPYVNLPAKLKLAAPLPSNPFVTMYDVVINPPFGGFLPKIPSPNIS